MRVYNGTVQTTETTFTGTASHSYDVKVVDLGAAAFACVDDKVFPIGTPTAAAVESVLTDNPAEGAVVSIEWAEELAEEKWRSIGHGDDLDTYMEDGTWYRETNGSDSNVVLGVPEAAGTGTFVLEVFSGGGVGQLVQRLTVCTKTKPTVFQRAFYQGSWGGWCIVAQNGQRVLWSGAYYMQASHAITLSEAVSAQKTGIILAFSQFDTSAQTAMNAAWHYVFVPKWHVSEHAGNAVSCLLTDAEMSVVGHKYIYVSDTQVSGHASNTASGTASGITYANKRFVLRAVLGV